MTRLFDDFRHEADTRIAALTAEADAGALDPAIDLLVDAVVAGGVLQAFGTGHSEAFAMEIAGRAGGLIPTNRIALRDVVPGTDLDTVAQPGIGAAIWLHATDVQAIHDALVAGGRTIVSAPIDGPFGRTFTFADPDGYHVTLHDRA